MTVANNGGLAYLPQTIGFILGLYIASVFIVVLFVNFLYCRNYQVQYESVDTMTLDDDIQDRPNKCILVSNEFFSGTSFESTYVSLPGLSWTSYLLCFTRSACFIFFLVQPCIRVYIENRGDNWVNFTFWNIDLIVLYFLFASISSIVGLLRNPDASDNLSALDHTRWSSGERFLAMVIQIFFTVAGACAIFITVFAYTFISETLIFDYLSYHLLNSVAMVFEMMLNSIIVRFEHIILLLSWAFLYIVYVWSMAATDRIPDWPYPFLATSTPSSFFFYGVSYVLFIVFFLIWYAISRIKIAFRGETIKPLLIVRVFVPVKASNTTQERHRPDVV